MSQVSRLVRTDDPAYRVEHVEHRGIIEARWIMIQRAGWLLVTLVPLSSWALWSSLAWLGLGPIWVFLSVILGGLPTASAVVWLLKTYAPHDSPTTPLEYHLKTIRRELMAPRPEQDRGFIAELATVHGPMNSADQPDIPEDFTKRCLKCP